MTLEYDNEFAHMSISDLNLVTLDLNSFTIDVVGSFAGMSFSRSHAELTLSAYSRQSKTSTLWEMPSLWATIG